jgi:hypothetical protein
MTASPVAHANHASFVSTPGAHAASDAMEKLTPLKSATIRFLFLTPIFASQKSLHREAIDDGFDNPLPGGLGVANNRKVSSESID